MSDYLLIGAGFSRNWGGWLATEAFEYLLGSPEVVNAPDLRKLLWRHQGHGGFEAALAELQADYERDPGSATAPLPALQTAISRMFADMNAAFMESVDWQFGQQSMERQIGTFLARFDCIFSLNQDVLLERHYVNNNITLVGHRKWAGHELPGMRRTPPHEAFYGNCWARSSWSPLPAESFGADPRCQPIYKLHGSANWMRSDGKPLLIIGGGKAHEIGRHPILNWYASEFERRLTAPNSKLMVIGYGFRDEHINATITKAVEAGLKLFIIAPEGAEIARQMNTTRALGQIVVQTPLEVTIQEALIGASRRHLGAIFGEDEVEFNKVLRFFST